MDIPKEIRYETKPTLRSELESDTRVILGIRTFPESDYNYNYTTDEIAYTQAKMEMDGYKIYTSIEMDKKCAKIIWSARKVRMVELRAIAKKL